MVFRTRLDYSNNRQIKQHVETSTHLSGATVFGMPFNQLPTGPDLTTSAITDTVKSVMNTFSGNDNTTIFTWYDPVMQLGYSQLSAITPSNSGMTQYVNDAYTPATTTVVDGITIPLTYTGVSYTLTPMEMIDLGGGNYSGNAITDILNYLSANALDFTGRTIWVDVSGTTRTDNLIITSGASIGKVWTCLDSEGKGYWANSSGGGGSGSGGTSYWSAGTGNDAIVTINSGNIASGRNSLAEGLYTNASGMISHTEGFQTTASGNYSHAGGTNCVASGNTSFVHGDTSIAVGTNTIVFGANITGNTDNTMYVDQLNIKTISAGPGTVDIGVDANGMVVNQASDWSLKENVSTLENALNKVKALRGVKYQWKDRLSGGNDFRMGFIAQEVINVEPLLVTKLGDDLLGIQYKDISALLVEAIKELSNEVASNSKLKTQTIIAEDNNIELNFNGTRETSIGGGISVNNAKPNGESAELKTDENGNWVTNNCLKPNELIIPYYTPYSTYDPVGSIGSLCRDDNYLYTKTNSGWRRTNFEYF